MERRRFMQAAGGAAAASAISGMSVAQTRRATFVVAHGAWSAGWAWKKMHPLMAAAGHRLITPTYTGLGEREHLASPSVDLDTHIRDVLGVIQFEDLRDFVLVGHSYGGMVATGVADRVPSLISKLIYLDAFVPKDGQALVDLVPPESVRNMRSGAQGDGGWRVPPNPLPADTPEEDRSWIQARRMAHPLKTLETPVKLQNGDTRVPRAYIYCKRIGPGDTFRPFAERAQREKWDYHEIDASHSPHITAPEALMSVLQAAM